MSDQSFHDMLRAMRFESRVQMLVALGRGVGTAPELARRLGYPESQVRDALRTMQAHGLIVSAKVKNRRTFSLSQALSLKMTTNAVRITLKSPQGSRMELTYPRTWVID